MTQVLLLFALFLIVLLVAIAWTQGIDHMERNHPDYKGEDFLDENF